MDGVDFGVRVAEEPGWSTLVESLTIGGFKGFGDPYTFELAPRSLFRRSGTGLISSYSVPEKGWTFLKQAVPDCPSVALIGRQDAP